MKDKREITIEELDDGYIIRLDWQYVNRPKGAFEPKDRKVIAADLDTAFDTAKRFMDIGTNAAMAESK